MKEQFELKDTFPVKPEVLYNAWLDSAQHSNMTGGEAVCTKTIGYAFTAWDGYISGTNQFLLENKRIVQTWRTTEFSDTDDDSELTLVFTEVPRGCELTLIHTNIPQGQANYKQGWEDHYFAPMREYFK